MSEPTERRKKLMETVKKFNKDNKSEVFTLGSEITDTKVTPSGVADLDELLGGGFKHSAHTIVYGPYSVGKTALIMTTVANAQKQGLLVCYVNTEKPIAPDRFKFFGVDLDELLYIEAPENAELALEALRTLCKDKVIDMFIIDSTNGLCPVSVQEGKEGAERGLDKKNVAALPMTLSNFYNVVNAQIYRAKAAVIWIGQLRTKGIGSYFTRDGLTGGNAQLFYAYQIIELRRGQKADNPKSKINHYFLDPDGKMHRQAADEEIGFDVVFKVIKTNSSIGKKENTELHIPYYAESGFNDPKFNADEIEKFVIEGTDEEKEIITLNLIQKGIIKGKVEERKFTKEECTALDEKDTCGNNVEEESEQTPLTKNFPEPKKQRGRPKKAK